MGASAKKADQAREQGIRDACAYIAQCGMDSSAINFAIAAMEHFGLRLEPTFKQSKTRFGTEVVGLNKISKAARAPWNVDGNDLGKRRT